MRLSLEEALSQLNKWKSEFTSVYVSTQGYLTLWLAGRISHASPAEVHIEIPGTDPKDFLLSVSLDRATFEYRDRLEPLEFWKPQRSEQDFDSVLEVRLRDRGLVVFAELKRRDIEAKP